MEKELMVHKQLNCVSCGKKLTNLRGSVSFKCPNCGEHDVVRCFYCRRISSRYTCPKCQFSGPN